MFLIIKRSLDIIIAGLGLLILSPLLIVISLVILIQIGRPVLFIQMRPGLKGKPFYMYKFRTMTDETDELGNLLPDEQRLMYTLT